MVKFETDRGRYQKTRDLFLRSCDLSEPGRSEYLDHNCDDRAMFDEVMRLLESETAETFGATETDETAADVIEAALDRVLSPGRRYRIDGLLERGGMGWIYGGRDLREDRRVAIKVVQPRILRASTKRRLEHEAHLMQKTCHPGVARLEDFGFADMDGVSMPYLVMEFVEGVTLFDLIDSDETRDANDWCRLIEQVASALEAVHVADVVHRDVKPQNVIVRPDGQPVLVDFGIARDLEGVLSSVTGCAESPGTPPYMAPEMFAGGTVDRRVDVWALGVTLFECLTKRLPFRGPTREAIAEKVQRHETPDLRRIAPGVPKDLTVVINTALEKNPSRRYRSAEAFAEDLRRVREARPVLAKPPGVWRRTKRFVTRHTMLTFAMALGVVVAVAVFMVQDSERRWVESEREAADLNRRAAEQREHSADVRYRMATVPLRLRASYSVDPSSNPEKAAKKLDAMINDYSELLVDLSKHQDELARLEQRGDQAAKSRDERLINGFDLIEACYRSQLGSPENASKLAARLKRIRQCREEIESSPRQGRPTFATDEDRRAYDDLAQLVGDLNKLEGGVLRDLERRRDWLMGLRARTVDRHEAAWDYAENYAVESELYSGVTVQRIPGLIPLGPNPQSGLLEFLHDESHGLDGVVPIHDDRGCFVMTERTGLVFVLVPALTATLGAQKTDPTAPNYDLDADEGEVGVFSVELAPFLFSKYEMTQGQWRHLTGRNPSNYSRERQADLSQSVSDRHPLESVPHDDLITTLALFHLRLPEENQWEAVVRRGGGYRLGQANVRGTETRRPGSDRPTVSKYGDSWRYHAPVGSFEPNDLGFHDLHGNVWEWCRDPYVGWRGSDADPAFDEDVRLALPLVEDRRVTRGGSFATPASDLRLTHRGILWNDRSLSRAGVRPVMPWPKAWTYRKP